MNADGTYFSGTAERNNGYAEGSFEASLAALEAVVARLEEGNLSLEATIDTFERGMELAGKCQQMLADAELRISRIETGPEAPDEDRGEEMGDADGIPF